MNHNGDVKFLYRLIEKAASQSFGIYVAKLAGIPSDVLKRSQQILKTLEKNHNHAQGIMETTNPEQLNFFSSIEPEVYTPEYLKDVEEVINSLDLNNLTPIQALNKLQELKDLIQYQ